MALMKEIELPNGVTVRYHRVASVNTVTNVQNTIEVASYTSRAKREEEREAVEAGAPMDVFVEASYHAAPYDQKMTVEGAYAWLKANAGEFAGAEDVLEDGR